MTTAYQQNCIALVFLPKFTILLDLAMFQPYKIARKKVMTEWKAMNKRLVSKRFPSLSIKALDCLTE